MWQCIGTCAVQGHPAGAVGTDPTGQRKAEGARPTSLRNSHMPQEAMNPPLVSWLRPWPLRTDWCQATHTLCTSSLDSRMRIDTDACRCLRLQELFGQLGNKLGDCRIGSLTKCHPSLPELPAPSPLWRGAALVRLSGTIIQGRNSGAGHLF